MILNPQALCSTTGANDERLDSDNGNRKINVESL
jgi:hypothetical protein